MRLQVFLWNLSFTFHRILRTFESYKWNLPCLYFDVPLSETWLDLHSLIFKILRITTFLQGIRSSLCFIWLLYETFVVFVSSRSWLLFLYSIKLLDNLSQLMNFNFPFCIQLFLWFYCCPDFVLGWILSRCWRGFCCVILCV